MQTEFTPPPGAVAEPTKYTAPPSDPGAKPVPEGEHVAWQANGSIKAPEINVLADKFKVEAAPAPVAEATPKKSKKPLVIGVTVASVLVLAGVTAAFVIMKPKPQVAVVTPSPTPSATPTPSPTPSPTPTPTPVPTPTPDLALTVPTVAPTSDHPQSSTVNSPSGLWLRSSPSSANKSNIIGWMPKGSVVSVDSIGDFWWHGTYKGQAGYFASKYTQ